jgi:hypothetical protein
VVKIFAFLGLEPRLNMKNGFNWAGKIEHFSKVSVCWDQAQGPNYIFFVYYKVANTNLIKRKIKITCYRILSNISWKRHRADPFESQYRENTPRRGVSLYNPLKLVLKYP